MIMKSKLYTIKMLFVSETMAGFARDFKKYIKDNDSGVNSPTEILGAIEIFKQRYIESIGKTDRVQQINNLKGIMLFLFKAYLTTLLAYKETSKNG